MMQGGEFIKETLDAIRETEQLEILIRVCLPDGTSNQDVKAVVFLLTRTYMRMRGKDFVRKLMGRKRRGANVEIRQKLAAISNTDKTKGKADSRGSGLAINAAAQSENMGEDSNNNDGNDSGDDDDDNS